MAATQSHEASAFPAFALIPGAWHSPSHFDPVTSQLHSAGYSTQSLRLPSVGSPNPEDVSTTTDAEFIIKNVLQPLVDSGKDVVLVMHSYGSITGTAAAVGLSKADCAAAGLPGGIIGIILIAAFIVRDGECCVSGDYPDWTVNNVCLTCDLSHAIPPSDQEPIQAITLDVTADKALSTFYQDVPSSLASEAIAQLLPHSINSFITPTGPTAWDNPAYNNHRAYIRTLQDVPIPLEAQNAMLAGSGVEWDVRDFDTGHSPFLVKPGELAATLIELAKAWVRKD